MLVYINKYYSYIIVQYVLDIFPHQIKDYNNKRKIKKAEKKI